MEIKFETHPFFYCVIDNFLEESLARKLASEFPDYNSDKWFYYNNALENKKAINSWYEFPPTTYRFMHDILSEKFVGFIKHITGTTCEVYPDYGLHGGGWHIQGNGGLLNVHLDYNLHPKTDKKRKFNMIIYLSDWDASWGGNLELWTHNSITQQPDILAKVLECKFNRAVIFDASMNSWHGLSNAIECPPDAYRKSIASYYLVDSEPEDDPRNRALFALRPEQNPTVELDQFIKDRSM